MVIVQIYIFGNDHFGVFQAPQLIASNFHFKLIGTAIFVDLWGLESRTKITYYTTFHN